LPPSPPPPQHIGSLNQSLFAIASNSKLFTAISIGLLINNDTKLPNGNTLGWDTKIADILPKDMWKLPDEYASAHVDIVDLMCEWILALPLMGG
jgi:CubicO group peptidase (beta-lactamase class C family)